jgi:hypothetical protein
VPRRLPSAPSAWSTSHPAAGCCAPWGFQDLDTYHWALAGPVLFDHPVPGGGRLGLYWLPADLLAAATEH